MNLKNSVFYYLGMNTLFKSPSNIFQQNINEILRDEKSVDLINDLIEIQMVKDSEKNENNKVFIELYNLLGPDKFYDVIHLLAGKTIKFPERDSFEEIIKIVTSYYLKVLKNKDWKSIKELFNDESLKTIKYGIKINQLQLYLSYLENRLKEYADEED